MINRATLTGRLTKNIDLRYTPSGIAVGNFTLAVDRSFVNRNGKRGTDFIRCVIWRKPAENLANFTHKGSLIGIDGQIRTGSYQNQQGERVYTTKVVIDNFALLESKRRTQATAPQQQQQPQQPVQPRQPVNNGNQQGNPMANQNNQPMNNGSQQGNPMANQNNQPVNNGGQNPMANQNNQPVNNNNQRQPVNNGNGNQNPQSNGNVSQQKPVNAGNGNGSQTPSDDSLPF